MEQTGSLVDNDENKPLVSKGSSSGRTIYSPDLKKYLKAVYFTTVASFGAVGFGITTVYASPLLDDLNSSSLNTSKWERGFATCASQNMIGPIAPIGAMFGAIFSSFFVRILGLVYTNMIAAVVSVVGWIMIGSSSFIPDDSPDGFRSLLLIGRFVTGFASGWAAATAPVYIAEIALPQMRGKLGGLFQVFIGLGTFIAYLFGGLIAGYWKSAFIFAAMFFIHSLLFLTVAEPPQRSRNPCKNGRKFINSLKPRSSSKHDVDITEESETSLSNQTSIFQWAYLWRILVIMVIMFFQRFSGISALVYYAGPILKSAGWNNPVIAADTVASLCIGFVLTVSTLLFVFVIDRMGRRIMLFFGSLGMALANVGLAAYFEAPTVSVSHNATKTPSSKCFHTLPDGLQYSRNLEALPLICLTVFCVSYAVSWGPVSWILSGEIFPKRIREIGSGIGSATNWLSTALVTLLFPIMSRSKDIGNGTTFFIFAGICLLSMLFVILCLPETRGLTLDQNSNLKFSIVDNVREFIVLMKWFFLCGYCRRNRVNESDNHVQSI